MVHIHSSRFLWNLIQFARTGLLIRIIYPVLFVGFKVVVVRRIETHQRGEQALISPAIGGLGYRETGMRDFVVGVIGVQHANDF